MKEKSNKKNKEIKDKVVTEEVIEKVEVRQELVYLDLLNKIFMCLLVIIAILAMNLIFTVVNNNGNSEGNDNTETVEPNADSSQFTSITAKEAVEVMDKDELSVIYFGSETCMYCQQFKPTMIAAQEKYGFKTYYINVSETPTDDDLDELISKMSKKVKYYLNGEEVETPYGETYGLTPVVIVVKDGKIIDGSVGGKTDTEYYELLENCGFKA